MCGVSVFGLDGIERENPNSQNWISIQKEIRKLLRQLMEERERRERERDSVVR